MTGSVARLQACYMMLLADLLGREPLGQRFGSRFPLKVLITPLTVCAVLMAPNYTMTTLTPCMYYTDISTYIWLYNLT